MASLGQKNTDEDHDKSFAEAEGNDIHCGAPHAQPQAVRLARQDLPLGNPPGQLPAPVPEMSPKGTLTDGTPLTMGVCATCGSPSCTYGLLPRQLQHLLVLSHKRPLLIKGAFKSHTSRKY